MKPEKLDDYSIEAQLRQGLLLGEVIPYYQPKIAINALRVRLPPQPPYTLDTSVVIGQRCRDGPQAGQRGGLVVDDVYGLTLFQPGDASHQEDFKGKGLPFKGTLQTRFGMALWLDIDAVLDVGDTFEALQAGALDVVQKPDLALQAGPSAAQTRLLETLRAMAGVKVIKRRARKDAPPTGKPAVVVQGTQGAWPAVGARVVDLEIVAIGASAGGPQALAVVLSALPASYRCPIVVTQHMVEGFITGAAKWLDERCQLNVKIAAPGEILRAGTVYFAPDHGHLRISRQSNHGSKGLIASIGSDAAIGGFRPAVNALLSSVADTCGAHAVGGILTGMGRDGDKGLLAMYKRGAITFAQDEQSSMIFGMPKAAIEAGAARHTLALNGIAAFLCNPMQGR